ncbi:MAG TPA: DUF3822 family protein [Flavilitoribacter sp.]|nr:DUF3822 family protein [Flavilitoribacter sp.]HMQ89784.1 DUF3822 family protein [Flavilitoribacter sp.]
MIKFDLVEDRFSVNDTLSCKLSILVGVDSFAYMVTDDHNHIKVIREYDFDKRLHRHRWLDQTLNADKWLQAGYSHTRIAIDDSRMALSPKRLFREEEKWSYLAHLSSAAAAPEVDVEEVDGFGAVLVYSVLPEIKQRLEQAFPEAEWTHLNACLLKALNQHGQNQPGFHLWVLVKDKQLKIMAFDRGALHFINSFPFYSAHDFLYYIMLVCQQVGVKPKDTPLYLAGRLMADSEIYRRLERYMPKLHFWVPPTSLVLGDKVKALPSYFFADLLATRQFG